MSALDQFGERAARLVRQWPVVDEVAIERLLCEICRHPWQTPADRSTAQTLVGRLEGLLHTEETD